MARHGDEPALANGDSAELGSPTKSRIPRRSPHALTRSSSLRLNGERAHQHWNSHQPFPVITENATNSPIRRCNSSLSLTPSRCRAGGSRSPGDCYVADDNSDAGSVRSFCSNLSTASACDHATFARNGTTYSAKTRRYVVHCSPHNDSSDQYLTPTQRANRHVRDLKNALSRANKKIEENEQEINRLTIELVELRLQKASLNSPDDKTDSSEAATVREKEPFSPESPSKELPADESTSALQSPRSPDNKREPSLVDSGHFDDCSVHSMRETMYLALAPAAAANANDSFTSAVDSSLLAGHDDSVDVSVEAKELPFVEERKKIVDLYEHRIEEMHRRHVDETLQLKKHHLDKVEGLLNELTEMNKCYSETRPSLDTAEARTKELEAEVEALRKELAEQKALMAHQEEVNKKMYQKMYSKGQEAGRMEQAEQIVVLEEAQKNASKATEAELRQQLATSHVELENLKAMYRRVIESRSNQAVDPEFKLEFLKSAIYHFLTDKDNCHVHLNAIESILGFTDPEKLNIDRIYRLAKK